jgi:hypothetical protein
MASTRGCVFGIGPPAWIKKKINSTIVETRLVSMHAHFSIDMSY